MVGARKRTWLLAALWAVSILTMGVQAAADCARPQDSAELTIESVTVDGSARDGLAPYSEVPFSLWSGEGYIDLQAGSSIEYFEVVP